MPGSSLLRATAVVVALLVAPTVLAQATGVRTLASPAEETGGRFGTAVASPMAEDGGGFGSAVAGAGDASGDNYDDFVIGAPVEASRGNASLFVTPPPSATEAPPAEALLTTDLPAVLALGAPFPNPSRARVTLPLDLPAAAVRADVFDALGRRVATVADGAMEAGRHRLALDATGLPSGVYAIRVTVGGAMRTLTQRLAVVR